MTGADTRVRAPGKAMLFGEYAVLRGAPALVAAVDRYAVAHLGDDPAPSPFVAAAVDAARRWLADRGLPAPTGVPVVDSTALRADGAAGRKLGLGSSAAVTVSAFGAMLRGAGCPIARSDDALAACDAAHRRAQGGAGSGADVAAALHGGVLRYTSLDEGPRVEPIAPADDLEFTLVDTGVAASTAERLARLRALEQEDPRRAAAALAPLLRLAADVAQEAGRTGRIDFIAVQQWNDALAALEQAIGIPILTPAHRAIAEVARAVGGAAKPSGAGGGDLAVCLTPRGVRSRLCDALARRGFTPVDVRLGAPGLHPVSPEEP